MKYYIWILTFLGSLNQSLAQLIYYSSIQSSVGSDNITTIGVFDLGNCSIEKLYIDTTDQFSGYIEWKDIALSPDGKLYGLGFDGIYDINLTNKTHSKLIGPPLIHPRDRGIKCTKDSVLIYGEKDVYSYDLKTQAFVSYGKLPTSLAIWGDLFWLDGNLMGSANDQIVQINLANPPSSQSYCILPKSGFLSLIQVAISCDSIAIFAFHSSGDIYLVNQDDCSMTYYCTIPGGTEETFQGSVPSFMFMQQQPCEIHIDLDLHNETLGGIDYRDTIYCFLPAKYLFSDLDLFSDKPWDSLYVWIENGPADVLLDGNSPPFALLTGKLTQELRYYATSVSDINDLSPYISEIILTGNVPNGVSMLKIGFCGWAKYLISDTAYAYITLIGRTTTAGEDDSIRLCISDSSLFLRTLLSPNTTQGGQWIPAQKQAGFFNPKIDNPGKYKYIIIDPICADDTAEFFIETITSPIFDLGPNRLLCPGDTIQLSINLSDVEFLWSDGSFQSDIKITQPEYISIEITDGFGCSYSDSLKVALDDNCIIDELYIPNIFSPNNDGVNDEWFISDNSGIQAMKFFIFDRWGNMLFSDKGKSIYWNGTTNNGEKVPIGVYVFELEILTDNYNNILKTGNITLIR